MMIIIIRIIIICNTILNNEIIIFLFRKTRISSKAAYIKGCLLTSLDLSRSENAPTARFDTAYSNKARPRAVET